MRTIWMFIVLTLVLIVVLQFSHVKAQPSKGQYSHFTISQTESIRCDGGTGPEKIAERRIFALREDGSRVTVTTIGKSILRELRLNNGILSRISDDAQIRSTYMPRPIASKADLNWNQMNPTRGCLYDNTGRKRDDRASTTGEEMVSGYRTFKTTRQTSSSLWITWYAPELDCYPLEHSVAFNNAPDGKVSSTSQLTTNKVELAEPDPNLFTIPGNYKELPLGEFSKARLVAKRLSEGEPPSSAGTFGPTQEASFERLNQQYVSFRSDHPIPY